ncbi:hypothetical protein P691DRAFT_788809 [Macrolepiota fuliginosa MF-IS2]|uniref:Serine/threonine-protein kinase Tel1 n=1 Tax=Macrolepiota fuliginosa MF-IS2 TaxID=1400762 RepID=A0A9P5XPU7_9AGAR|nr:hypothetical protein P691DRAFT_788809 [Macrolepiota fuliginosa MF-IS2]
MANLGEVLKKLESSKVTERQEALGEIRTVFSKKSFLQTFHLGEGDDETEDRNWMLVFNALFTMVRMEKAEYAKSLAKGTQPKPTVVKRLTDAASTVRWLVEGAVTFLRENVVTQVVHHLKDGMVSRNEVLTPIALDYAKAARCLLSFRPHLEHLSDADWVDLVAFAFNIVLGDPPKAGLNELDAESDEEEKEEEEEEEEEDDELPSLHGKRKRGGHRTGAPHSFSSRTRQKSGGSKTIRQISVSLEQVEFVSILSILLSYSGSPILSPDYPYLPQAILSRLHRFLVLYPADSSLLHDYLMALSATLDQLALNRVKDTQKFARKSWDILLGLWNTKDKRIKEHLIAAIRTLLPYLTADFGTKSIRDSYDLAGALWKLYNVLEGEADHRRGIEGLLLDSLRLDINPSMTGGKTSEPFIAHTFCAGWNFDNGQAISWAVLETLADCVAKLYELSESMNSGATPVPLRGEKKRKLDSGVSSLLSGSQTGPSQHARIFYLQVLLFVIDRHWLSLHHALKLQAVESLLQLVTSEDASIQTWTFLCLAAVVYAERFLARAQDVASSSQSLQSQSQVSYETGTWDSIWTHSIRRINAPATCRAASHTAYTLIFQAHGSLTISLPSQRILSEIETFALDLEVQGPANPYDSVCNFLSQCVRLASQDARLYRLHLEDKVVGWMIDHWKVAGATKIRGVPQTLQDGINLLEAICGLARKSCLISRTLLPVCTITAAIEKESSEKSIRDFLLSAKLPSFEQVTVQIPDNTSLSTAEVNVGTNAADLTPPQPRERKISAFLLRSVELLITEWEGIVENHTNITADAARQSLEHALTSLVFESLLVYNGILANRHAVQASTKLITIITPLLHGSVWNLVEKATVLHALEPLILLEEEEDLDVPRWETMLPPGPGSGIKRRIFHKLVPNLEDYSNPLKAWRTNLLRVIWQLPDAQECLQSVVAILRRLFCSLISGRSSATNNMVIENEERDGFGPVRIVSSRTSSAQTGTLDDDPFVKRTMDVCMRFIAAGPLLHSVSGEPTKDAKVTDAILGCGTKNANGFLTSFSLLLSEVRRKTFGVGSNLQCYLDALDDFFGSYEYEQSERMQHTCSQFLHAILESWLSNAEIRNQVQALPKWLLKRHRKEKAKYRIERDAFIRFVDKLVRQQPRALQWLLLKENEELSDEALLSSLPLRVWNKDNDIRVRFRVAVLNARLFHALHHLDIYPSVLYTGIQSYFNQVEVHQYEHILSRFLALGNIIVASASAYASQMGYSMMKSDENDIARIPPHLIGFEDRKQSATFTLSAFAPTYITSRNGPRFEAHCNLVGVSPQDTFTECFGDIIGAASAYWFQEHPEGDVDQLETALRETSYSRSFDEDFQHNADGVALAVLRSLSDQVISPAGAIHQRLEAQSNSVSQTFAELVKYRLKDRYDLHEPNLPSFDISVVLRTLTWLLRNNSTVPMKAITYHILHGLFAAIQLSPVVNEQLRLVNALAVWIALQCEDFNDVTLLHTLIQGATALLAEYDLAHAAQCMLEWAFRLYRRFKLKDSAFSNIIIRVCSIAHDYARSRYGDFRELGTSLMDWVDKQAVTLSNAAVQVQVSRALPTWPYPPVAELEQIATQESSEALAALLGDSRITYNKFRLVRRLHDHAARGGKLKSQFPKLDFWRLKDCVPHRYELQEEDVGAFASLLLLNHGDIGGLTGEHQSRNTIFTRYRRLFGRKYSDADPNFTRDVILYSLLQLLDNHTTTTVFSAYETLRRAMAVLDNLQVPSGSADYNTELGYLRAFPRQAKTRPPCRLSEALTLEGLIESTANFNQWITILCSKLSDCLAQYNSLFAQLSPILQSNADIAAELLPVMIHAVLQTEINDGKYTSKEYRHLLTNYLTSVLVSQRASVACRQSVIDVVLHLRQFVPRKEVALSYNRWLDLDYMVLAQNAVSCGAYTTALLFLELNSDHPVSRPGEVPASEELLYEIYSHIDEPDGFYGIKTKDLQQFLIRRFHHEKQWEKALQFHGAAVEADPTNAAGSDGLFQSFSSFGFNHLVMDTLRLSGSASSSVLDYRLGWRTETWDLPERKDFSSGSSLYFALRALYRERNPRTTDTIIQRGFWRTMDKLRTLGSENMTEIREIVQEIMCLKQVNDWRNCATQNRLQRRDINIDEWSDLFNIDPQFDFSDLENIMTTRVSLLRSARQKEERQQIGNMVTPLVRGLKEAERRCLIRLSQAARDANRVQIALNSVMRAQKLDTQLSVETAEEYANVLWEQKEQQAAIQYLQSVIGPLDSSQDHDAQKTTHRALLRARLGSWIAMACLENPSAIWENYLHRAVNELDATSAAGIESSKRRATVYHDCALFAERQYHAILKSPDTIRWKVYVDRKRQEIQHRSREMASTSNSNLRQSLQREQTKAQKILQEDSEQFRKHNAARDQFLERAVEMNARSLEMADTFDDDAPIRFCSLWFANFENEGEFQSTIDVALSRIPSHKMVFLAHQLTARLSSPTGQLPQSQENLQKMVLRMCQEHPFHSLYQLYCLLPERNLTDPSRRQSSRQTAPSTQTERGSAAQICFDRLRADPIVGDKVSEVEKLCNACWQWAKHHLETNKYNRSHTAYQIPTNLLICRLANLRVPVTTVSTPLDPTMRYDDCIWVDSFEKQFETAGGISLPKISVCKGTNGMRYKQLFKGGKGGDDLRQDAVMEQVFDVVNAVLRRDRQTKRRELGVKRYKVIPLDSQSGLLEFVTNTAPLRSWLDKGHKSYRPRDLGLSEVRDRHVKGYNAYKADMDSEKLLQNFREIRSKFQPVMRHYFTEKSKSPVMWFSMRLKYTRSVATTSIVGHILGLGDRHTSNILLDNVSGEVVHIDLGIAFDQGKLLPVPERVPFRMTADMVDGMGSSGTTGVFQRCAEETLRVLRDGSDVIMTVLEVFKHDPLHSWTLSETKVKNAQGHDQQQPMPSNNDLPRQALGIGIDMSSGTAEEAADRALSSVARKLDKSLSVEYTVNQLIAEATDPFNLATIFSGWQPHY